MCHAFFMLNVLNLSLFMSGSQYYSDIVLNGKNRTTVAAIKVVTSHNFLRRYVLEDLTNLICK